MGEGICQQQQTRAQETAPDQPFREGASAQQPCQHRCRKTDKGHDTDPADDGSTHQDHQK